MNNNSNNRGIFFFAWFVFFTVAIGASILTKTYIKNDNPSNHQDQHMLQGSY